MSIEVCFAHGGGVCRWEVCDIQIGGVCTQYLAIPPTEGTFLEIVPRNHEIIPREPWMDYALCIKHFGRLPRRD